MGIWLRLERWGRHTSKLGDDDGCRYSYNHDGMVVAAPESSALGHSCGRDGRMATNRQRRSQDLHASRRCRGMRPSAVLTVLLCVSALGVGCAELDEQGTSTAPSEAVEAVAVASAPPEQVASCVEQIKFGAFTGEAVWSQVWTNVGQTDEGATADCTQLGTDNPGELALVHEGWLQVQAFLAAADADPVAPPAAAPPPPAPAPANVYYANCDAVRAAGAAPIYRGDPGYSSRLDREGDGIGCEN